jgi:predicted signal transduction protein with EAL and GGDEF domain
MSSDEDSRNMAIKVVAGLFMSIATVAVMLRCYVRGWIVKAFGWDDGSMVIAMVMSPLLIACICCILTTIYRPGMQCSLGQ